MSHLEGVVFPRAAQDADMLDTAASTRRITDNLVAAIGADWYLTSVEHLYALPRDARLPLAGVSERQRGRT